MHRLAIIALPVLLLLCFIAGLPCGYWIMEQSLQKDEESHNIMVQADAVHAASVQEAEVPNDNSVKDIIIMQYMNEEWKRWLQNKRHLDEIRGLQCHQNGMALSGRFICYDLTPDVTESDAFVQ